MGATAVDSAGPGSPGSSPTCPTPRSSRTRRSVRVPRRPGDGERRARRRRHRRSARRLDTAGVSRRPAHRRAPRLRGHLHRRGRGPVVPGAALRRRRHRPRRRRDGRRRAARRARGHRRTAAHHRPRRGHHRRVRRPGPAVRCAEWWQHDGFVVGVEIVDRVYRRPADGIDGARRCGPGDRVDARRGRHRHRRSAADHRRRRRRAGARRPRRLRRRQPGGREQRARADRLSAPRQREPAAGARRRRHRLAPRRLAASISPVTFPRDLDPVPQRRSVHQPLGIGDRRRDRLRRRWSGGRLRGVGRRRRRRIGVGPRSRRPHGRELHRARAAPSTATSGGAATASCSA